MPSQLWQMTAQEGVGGEFGVQRGWQRGLVPGHMLAVSARAGLQCGIVGFDREREGNIAQGIFVGAEHPGRARKPGQFFQRVIHLFGTAFKQAAAATPEQRVATEQQVLFGSVPGDVAGGVSGHVDDL